MADDMEIQAEVQRRGARSNQKLKLLADSVASAKFTKYHSFE